MSTYATDTFAGDGSTVEFTLTFEYISRDHVKVYRVENDTKDETELTVIESGVPVGDQYVWDTDEQITVGTAPTADQTLRVQRDTPEDEQIVQWKDGSYIIAEDLNTSDKQWLYGLQELEDKVASIDGTVIGEAVKSISGIEPVIVDSTDDQKPVISVDLTTSADDLNALDSDAKLMSENAIDDAFKVLTGAGPFTGNKVGQSWIDNTQSPNKTYFWNGSAWIEIQVKGDKGDQGNPGPPPGLQDPAATATTIPNKPDDTHGDATAVVSQDGDFNLQFQFGIPTGSKGSKGDKGDKGDPGDGVTYKGGIDATTAPEPTDPKNGDFYVNTADGTSSWTGLGTVVDGSRLVWNEATSQWDEFTPTYATNLDYDPAADKGTITNTNGTDAEIPLATTTNAGLMSPADKAKVDTDPTLQSVVAEGDTSTNSLFVGDNGQSVGVLNTGVVQASGGFEGDVTGNVSGSAGTVAVSNSGYSNSSERSIACFGGTAGQIGGTSDIKFAGTNRPTIKGNGRITAMGGLITANATASKVSIGTSGVGNNVQKLVISGSGNQSIFIKTKPAFRQSQRLCLKTDRQIRHSSCRRERG